MFFFRTLAFFLLLATLPQPGTAGQREDILSFADALFAEGDHYRAITEYKRFLHLFPGDTAAARAALGIAESYLAGERWQEAEQALEKVEREFPGSPEALRGRLLLAECANRRGDFSTARQRLRRLAEEAADPRLRNEALYRSGWTLIEEDRYADADRELEPLPDARAEALAAEMPRMEQLPRKSPRLAGGLSALLPGAGQLYAERPRDAALAFLLNAAFIAGAWEAFDSGNEAVGALLLFFEAGWYTGNIYNAANNAHKYNRDIRTTEKEKLRERFGLTLGLHKGAPTLGVALRY